jgi:hypothetical protein
MLFLACRGLQAIGERETTPLEATEAPGALALAQVRNVRFYPD